MNKRAQFYFLATIVILIVVASFVAIYNVALTKKENVIFYDLSKEIEFESSKVLDRGTFFAEGESQIKTEIRNVTDYYAYANPGQDLIVVYANEKNVNLLYYNNTESGSVGFSFGGSQISLPLKEITLHERIIPRTSNTITINIAEGINYTSTLRKGQVLFVVLKKENNGERYLSAP